MSSDEEEDIAASLLNNDVSSDEEQSQSEGEYEIQDEILSDDEEDAKKPSKKASKKDSKKDLMAFPSLEADDDDDEEDEEQFLESVKQEAARSKAKSKGSFASFGLSNFLLNNIKKKGYRQPTPIQRKTLPLIVSNRDVVGMARTGSGKTAAFLLPLVEKLKTHSPKVGVRAIVLSPTRELAMQTYKQLKEFSKGTDLRSLLLVGGDSLEDQFSAMVNNPDVIVATPGRFLHLKVEMRLDLRTVEYVVYDEADRLFEMGFSEQLNELLASLPEERQSLLFSATLPKNLVDFAKAGLKNPVLVRLDAESKISENLEMAFISTKKNERDANLLYLLQDVIKMPFASREQLEEFRKMNEWDDDDEEARHNRKKRRRPRAARANELPSEHATIVFVPTKHHVDYVTGLLQESGYSVAYIYGSLDQYARRRQLLSFRSGVCSIMVVTDVAARGIDIPILANVINYTFPTSSKLFVHRVGRTARAGNKGWAYSIVGEAELPYLLDLELFLGRKVLLTSMQEKKTEIMKHRYEEKNGTTDGFNSPTVSYTVRLVLGSAPRAQVEEKQEECQTILKGNYDLRNQQRVCEKANKMLIRSRQPASNESVRRAKEMEMFGWDEQNLLFGKNLEMEKDKFLERLQNRRHKETVFELAGADDLIDLMAKRRKDIAPIQEAARKRRELLEQERTLGLTHRLEDELDRTKGDGMEVGFSVKDTEDASEELLKEFEDADELEANRKRQKREAKAKSNAKKSYRDPNFYISHFAPTHKEGGDEQISDFAAGAQTASFDVAGDDVVQNHKQTQKVVWDKKKKRYVKNQDDTKYIIGENGQRLPATFRAGKFDEWKKKHRFEGYRVGATEGAGNGGENELTGGKQRGRFVHKQSKAPKMPVQGSRYYDQKMEKVKKAVEKGVHVKGYIAKGSGHNELRSTEQIRKERAQKDQRKAKNARRPHRH